MRAITAISWKHVAHIWNFEKRRWEVVSNIVLGEEHRIPAITAGVTGEAIAQSISHLECLREVGPNEVPEPDSTAGNMHRMSVLASSLLM